MKETRFSFLTFKTYILEFSQGKAQLKDRSKIFILLIRCSLIKHNLCFKHYFLK